MAQLNDLIVTGSSRFVNDINGYIGAGRKAGSTKGQYSTAEGYDTVANSHYSHAEGYKTTANNNYAHAEGANTYAKNQSSHAEGHYTTAYDLYSHAEGANTSANGQYSHAEGGYTSTKGSAAHAEGFYTYAFGDSSHAEGATTTAEGVGSHVSGLSTCAAGAYQTVIGKYNLPNTTDAFIIGGGTSSAKKNIFNVNWDGRAFANGIQLGNKPYVYNQSFSNVAITTRTGNQYKSNNLSITQVLPSGYTTLISIMLISTTTYLIVPVKVSNTSIFFTSTNSFTAGSIAVQLVYI